MIRSGSRGDFLAALERIEAQPDADAARAAEGLAAAAAAAGIERALWEVTAAPLHTFHLAVDAMAIRAQASTTRSDYAVALLSTVSVALGATGIAFGVWVVPLAAAEAVTALVGALWIAVARRERSHALWTRSRYLAEHARIALFAHVADVDLRPILGRSIESLAADADPSHWVRGLLEQRLAAAFEAERPHPELSPTAAGFLADRWLDEQAAWHRANSSKKGRFARLLNRTGSTILWVTVGVAVLVALLGQLDIDIGTGFGGTLTLLSILLPAVSTSAFLLGSQREIDRVAARSAHMAKAFARHAAALRQAATPEARRRVVQDAVSAACTENYEWSVLMETAPR